MLFFKNYRTLLFLLMFAVPGCTPSEIETHEDRGELCLRSLGESDPGIPANQPLELLVLDYFHPQPTHEPISAACSVTVHQNQLHVTSEFVVKRTDHTEDTTGAEEFGLVSCPVEALDVGEYQLIHGDRTEAIFVPSDEDVLDCDPVALVESSVANKWRFEVDN